MTLTIAEIARILGIPLPQNADPSASVEYLLTDSRSLLTPEGTLFFAIPTATGNGIRYMRALYDRGVRLFIAPEIPEDFRHLHDAVVLTYPDPVEALQKITSRRTDSPSANTRILAITGSKGKTTLKEWLFQLLEPYRSIARSPRSWNSQIGVPLSMWEIQPHTGLAIIEAGISKAGEMRKLRECIRPDTVILTDILSDHDEGFSGRAEKIHEKLSLAAGATTSTVIYNRDDAELHRTVSELPGDKHLISFSLSNPEADLLLTFHDAPAPASGALVEYRWRNGSAETAGSFHTPIQAYPQLTAAALAFMLSEGFGNDAIASRFAVLHPIQTRLSVADGKNGCSIIYDSYTSDFSSLAPAVDFLMRRCAPGQEPALILSDFRHETLSPAEEASRIAALLRTRGITKVYGVGKTLAANAAAFGPEAKFFDNTADLLVELHSHPLHNAALLVKGAPEFEFHRLREALEARTHETVLEVNLDALVHNYNYFKSHLPSDTGMVAMVKASGYGAGSYEIAKTLQDAGAAYLAVAVLDEGLDLRRRGITMPIMVMNPRVADYREMFANALEPEIYTLRMLDEVIGQAQHYGVEHFPIHIKLDTGMHRMGFTGDELPALMERLASPCVRIASAFSHLATADCPDLDDYTLGQLQLFDRLSQQLMEGVGYRFKRHILNSAGILRFPQYHYDLARLGIGLYGVNTLPPEIEQPLASVSTLKTVIINLRKWPAGTAVGYARKGVLGHDAEIATLPIGYADGMNRAFGNGALSLLVNGKLCPTVGNICMDACMVDVTGAHAAEGDTAVIFGPELSLQRMADTLGTIPYEILTSVSPRVKRTYYRE